MTRLSEDFETGPQGSQIDNSNSIFTSSNGTALKSVFDTGSKLFGTYGMHHFPSGDFYQYLYTWSGNQAAQYFRWYQYIITPSSSGQAIIAGVTSSTTFRAQVVLGTTGILSIRNVATIVASTTNSYTGKWIRVEWDVVGSTQTLRVFSGANLYGTTPDETISGPISTTTWATFRFGSLAAATFNMRYDGLEIDSVSTPGPAADPAAYVDATYIWNGTAMVASDCFIWDGTTLQPADPLYWNGSTLS